MRGMVKYFAIVVLLLVCGEASAQKMKERSCVRKGNEDFNKGEYKKSIAHYEEALQHDPNSFEAKFDLGSALYCNERYEEAEKTLLPLLDNESLSEIERGEVAYNLGNTQFEQQKYQEALSSYRFAMRCNPDDEDAKHNYFLTKLMLKQQEQQQNQDNKDNKDNKQDQNQDQNQNNQGGNDQQDKNKQEKKDDKNKQDKDNQQQPQDQKGDKEKQKSDQRPEGGMSPKQQEAILQAIQAQEDKTQDKVKEKAGVVIVGGKNW